MAVPLPEPRVSIIIPVLNEADQLADCLDHLYSYSWVRESAEIIVCDGGSNDGTVQILNRYPCQYLTSPRGRALQMNRGAEIARGAYLLFLHADSRLPNSFDGCPSFTNDWGFFRVGLDDAALVYRIIETTINWRTSLTRIAGGDQGLFFERDFFSRIYGFPPIPLMEDIAISKQARSQSRPQIIQARLRSSSRRWKQNGIVKTILLMWMLRLAYWLGVSPRRLHRIYYPQRG